jgi:drug/metabolite transporter (DMT)-like permease
MLEEKLFSKDYNNLPQLISNFDSITSKKNEKEINNSNLLINNNNEDATSFKDKISEKIGSIKSYFKRERLGLFYCILAQFLGTSNNVILKFITKKYSTKFTNKSYLLSRGIAIVIIAYICGKHFDKKIYKLSDFEPNIKKCLLIRSNLSFFGMSFWLLAVYYLRISTCQIIASLSPILVIFLGVFFLNEPYYNRYAFGIVLGIVGSCIIILNENKLSNNKKDASSTLSDVVIGLLSMAANISITGIVWVVNKIMATKKISLYAQLLYFGIFHTTYGFLWMLFTMDFDYSFGYLFLCSTQAILFFLGNYYNYLGLKLIDLNKISIIQYTSIVFVLILGIIFLKEKIFFSDIIGSSIIVSFMIYHAMNPIK